MAAKKKNSEKKTTKKVENKNEKTFEDYKIELSELLGGSEEDKQPVYDFIQLIIEQCKEEAINFGNEIANKFEKILSQKSGGEICFANEIPVKEGETKRVLFFENDGSGNVSETVGIVKNFRFHDAETNEIIHKVIAWEHPKKEKKQPEEKTEAAQAPAPAPTKPEEKKPTKFTKTTGFFREQSMEPNKVYATQIINEKGEKEVINALWNGQNVVNSVTKEIILFETIVGWEHEIYTPIE